MTSAESTPAPRILFVCLGNICRSPAAEAVTARLAREAGVEVVLDSAGTGTWHLGEPPHGPMQRAAGRRGYDLAALRARLLTPADFRRFDRIYAMDEANLAAIEAMRPGLPGGTEVAAGGLAEVGLLLALAPELGLRAVPDPYYTGDFEGALDLIEHAVRALVAGLVADLAEGRAG